MNINRINDVLRKAINNAPTPDGTIFVCKATEEEWNAFAQSEDPEPAMKINLLEWFETAGEIHIIEFPPSAAHDSLMLTLHDSFRASPGVKRWLKGRGGCANRTGRQVVPDLSYGPAGNTPHAVLPRPGMEWRYFNTIKIEVGLSQRWGDRAGQLDHKATKIWPAFPGVEYVLCVKSNDDHSVAEYKLYDLPGGSFPGCAAECNSYRSRYDSFVRRASHPRYTCTRPASSHSSTSRYESTTNRVPGPACCRPLRSTRRGEGGRALKQFLQSSISSSSTSTRRIPDPKSISFLVLLRCPSVFFLTVRRVIRLGAPTRSNLGVSMIMTVLHAMVEAVRTLSMRTTVILLVAQPHASGGGIMQP